MHFMSLPTSLPMPLKATAVIASLGYALWRMRYRACARASAVIALGGAMNSVAMLANHNLMPVLKPHALISPQDTMHSELLPTSHLVWLTDVHGVSSWRYSLGDVVALSGELLLVLVASWYVAGWLLRQFRRGVH
jgi:hypothetical protein